MARRFFAQVRQQWMGALALFLVIAGGTAYAADTIGSSDIIDESILSQDIKNGEVKTTDLASNAVQTGKIGNNQVFSEDVRDDTLSGGGLAAVDLADHSVGTEEMVNQALNSGDIGPDSVGGSELEQTQIFDNGGANVDDPAGGAATEVELVNAAGYVILGRCTEAASGGAVTARVIARSFPSGPAALTLFADSDAPSGQTDVVNVAPGAEVTLASFGPTTNVHWGAGDYALAGNNAGTGPVVPLSGVVGVGTKVAGLDCRFSATGAG